jgi:hypothetical protein
MFGSETSVHAHFREHQAHSVDWKKKHVPVVARSPGNEKVAKPPISTDLCIISSGALLYDVHNASDKHGQSLPYVRSLLIEMPKSGP